LHRTTVVARDAGWIEVANLEVLDGTPVVDLKPVIRTKSGRRDETLDG
jgi:tRNA (Thr-GGU) A37 N-methylase